jgi:hypothetical protein
MVGVLEMNQKISRKERILKWWKVEGKIECGAASIALIVLILFWDNLLVQGIVAIFGALWGFAKIYFRRDQWAFLLLISTLVLVQGISMLLKALR